MNILDQVFIVISIRVMDSHLSCQPRNIYRKPRSLSKWRNGVKPEAFDRREGALAAMVGAEHREVSKTWASTAEDSKNEVEAEQRGLG